MNKWDKTISDTMCIMGEKCIPFSNKSKLNLDLLLDSIKEEIAPSTIHVRLLLPYKEGKLGNLIETKTTIYSKEYQNYGIYYDIEIPIKMYHMVQPYDLDNMVS